MNRKLPYEELIAEKLRHLQLPNQDQLWQLMKAELDAEMPVSKKRRRGYGNWWQISLIVLVMVGGTWGVLKVIQKDEIRKQKVLSSVAQKHPETAIAVAPPEENEKNTVSAKEIDLVDNAKKSFGENISETIERGDNNPKSEMLQNSIATNNTPGESLPNLHLPNLQSHSKEGNPTDRLVAPITANHQQVQLKNIEFSNHKILPGLTEPNFYGIKLSVPAYVSALPDVSVKKKLLLREIKRQERKEEKEMAKSYRTYRSFWGESTDRWFAAGLAPYQNIAVSTQQPYHYNSSAGRNIITDYIPSPYLQLHLTNRIYLLSEFQFNTPQATPSILLSQKSAAVPINSMGYTENIYLRKLYYFNMPVSFYYSPIKNFYLGSGLQFSSFNSGLADMEQRSANNTLLHSETIKLKDDSLSAMINGAEWRYLFDANYYYNRFMFGIRYNQALSSFANFRMNNALAPTQARNQAFQLYIRYNLVVSGRK